MGVGVTLFWNANRRQEVRLRNIGLGLIAAPVALVTISYLVDTDREKCLEAGASDYIAKPVNTEQLLSLLRVWLYR